MYYSSMKPIAFPVSVEFTLNLDLHLRRAYFDSGKQTENFKIDLLRDEVCKTFSILFKNTTVDIYKPIQLELHHHLPENKIVANLQSTDFCEDCVALDPDRLTFVTNEIPITTGCKNQRCNANLIVESLSNNELCVLIAINS